MKLKKQILKMTQRKIGLKLVRKNGAASALLRGYAAHWSGLAKRSAGAQAEGTRDRARRVETLLYRGSMRSTTGVVFGGVCRKWPQGLQLRLPGYETGNRSTPAGSHHDSGVVCSGRQAAMQRAHGSKSTSALKNAEAFFKGFCICQAQRWSEAERTESPQTRRLPA